MMIDELVGTMLTQLPNLAIAVWMLWQQQLTIKALMDSNKSQTEMMLSQQQKLIDQLLAYANEDREMAARARSVSAMKVTAPS